MLKDEWNFIFYSMQQTTSHNKFSFAQSSKKKGKILTVFQFLIKMFIYTEILNK